jgi:hypothetical protein
VPVAIVIAALLVAGGGVAAALIASGALKGSSSKPGSTTTTVAAPGGGANGTAPHSQVQSSTVPLTPYSTASYAAARPSGWSVMKNYEPQPSADNKPRFLSTFQSPDRSMSVTIDTTLGTSGDPSRSARTGEAAARAGSGFRRLVFEPTTISGGTAFDVAFAVNGSRKDIIYFFSAPNGYGIVGESPPAGYAQMRAATRAVAQSIKPTG